LYFFCNDYYTFRCVGVCNAHFNFTELFKFHALTVVFKSFFIELCKCTLILSSELLFVSFNDFFVSSNFVVVVYKFFFLPFLLCTYSCILLCITIVLYIRWSE
jgi:hypothetical protein